VSNDDDNDAGTGAYTGSGHNAYDYFSINADIDGNTCAGDNVYANHNHTCAGNDVRTDFKFATGSTGGHTSGDDAIDKLGGAFSRFTGNLVIDSRLQR
jgi:hypothetical protein